MRIVAGEYGGRTLKTPKDNKIRPTSDKVRGAVFNMIISRMDLDGARVLDGFCGTGALGLEALSRGAGYCLFTDKDSASASLCRENITALGAQDKAQILKQDVCRLSAPDAFDLILLDPPYGHGLAQAALENLAAQNMIATGAIIVIEEDKKADLNLPDLYMTESEKTYGDTKVMLLRYISAPE